MMAIGGRCTRRAVAGRFLTLRQNRDPRPLDADHEHDPRRRHRRGRHGQPAGERPHRGRAGSSWPTSLTDARARTRRCGSSCCAPRAAGSTPASTSRRCRRPRASTPCIGANRGCYAAFAAVYECPVPVIAAVNGFCLGGGIGLVGNADVIVAADDATFGLPEVDRGALGAATHLSRLVPQHKMRAMVYTSATATAAGAAPLRLACTRSCPRPSCATPPCEVAGQIAAKSPTVIRAAKESLNGIDLVGREAQLPLRAGLHLRAQPVRRGRRAPRRVRRQARHGHAAVSERRQALHRGGGRRRAALGDDHRHRRVGIRRKPMSVVRALLRTDLTDLTVVS